MRSVILFHLVSLLVTLALGQGIDSPCNPFAGDEDPQCTGSPHLFCSPIYNFYSNGTCRCQSGSFWHEMWLDECRVGANNQCLTGTGAAECTPFSSCKAPSGGGDEDLTVCECDLGTYPQAVGSYCVAGHGTHCANSTTQFAQCDSVLRLTCTGSDLDNRVCECAGANIWSDTRGKCLGTIETSSSCSTNDDCVDNAMCIRNDFGIARCSCLPGFSKNDDNTCSLAYGASCDPSSTASLKCNEAEMLACSADTNTCTCADGRLLTSGKCLGVADHDCESHADCGGDTLCHQNLKKCFCSAAREWIHLVDRTCGRLGRSGYCRLAGFEDCPANEYLRCNPILGTTYGRCECIDDTVADENGRCVREVGSTCVESNHNCVQNAACVKGVCTCLEGSAPTNDGQCLKTFNQVCDLNPGSGNQCNADQGLIGCDNGESSGRCICPAGQEWNEGRGHCVALTSGVCDPDTSYCTNKATCNSLGFCECAIGYAQRSPDDRHCAPSHGTECHPTTSSCSEHSFLTCQGPSTSMTCECESRLYQTWDGGRGQCVSVLGGPCGSLEEHVDRSLQCIETSTCLTGADLIPRCVCDEESGREPDGQGKCRIKEEPTTTTTTTASPPPSSTTTVTTTTTQRNDDDDDGGAGQMGASAIIVVICACALNLFL